MSTTFISQLYQSLLGREADEPGVQFWAAQMQSGAIDAVGVTQAFVESVEFDTFVEPITRLYFSAFNRAPDADGLTHWVGALRQGATITEIAEQFVQSSEYQTEHALLSDRDYIESLYQRAFGRDAESSGLGYWSQLLESGAPRSVVLASFTQSEEMIALRGEAAQYSALHLALTGTSLPMSDLVQVLPVQSWAAVIQAIYTGPNYQGVDVPGISRYVEPEPRVVPEPEPEPEPDPDTTAPTIVSFTAAPPATLAVTSSEAGTARLLDGATVLVSQSLAQANTTYSLPVSAQSVSTSASLEVADFSGNVATSPIPVVLGTTGQDTFVPADSGQHFMFGFDGDDRFQYNRVSAFVVDGQVRDVIVGGAGENTIHLLDSGPITIAATDSFANVSDVETLVAMAANTNAISLAFNADAFTAGLRTISLMPDTDPLGTNLIDGSNAASDQALVLYGSSGSDSLIGGAGADILEGGVGADTLDGGLGNDVFRFTDNVQLRNTATVIGGDGTDTIAFSNPIDTLTQNSPQGDNFHADFNKVSFVEQIVLTGANKINLGDIFPAAGINTIVTGDDDTTLRYDNTVLGAMAVDTVALADNKTLTLTTNGPHGGHLFDVTNLKGNVDATGLSGAISVTAATGTGFDVSVTGGAGADSLSGGDGNDTIAGGAGLDTLNGGGGDDRFIYASSSDLAAGFELADIIDGGSGTNTLVIGNNIGTQSAFQTTSTMSWSRMSNVTEIEAVGPLLAQFNIALSDDAFESGLRVVDLSPDTNTSGNSNIINVSAESGAANGFTLLGSSYIDTITGGAGNDTITGGAGADRLNAGAGINVINAGDGLDVITVDTASTNTVNLSLGGVNNQTQVIAGAGTGELATTITAGTLINEVGLRATAFGSAVGVIMTAALATGTTTAWFEGGNGADSMTGSLNADYIVGGNGNDTITGGAGADSLYGSDGDDTFIFASAAELREDAVVAAGGGTNTLLMNTGSASLILVNADFINVNDISILALAGTGSQAVTLGTEINRVSSAGITVTTDATAAGLNLQGALSSVSIHATGTNSADTLVGGAADDVIAGGAGSDTFVIETNGHTKGDAYNGLNSNWSNVDAITDFDGAGQSSGDSINLGHGANAFGAGITFTTSSTANVTAVTIAGGSVDDINDIFAQIQSAISGGGVASSSSTAQIYDVTLTTAYAGVDRLLIINNNVAGIANVDAVINMTGMTGALDAQDFTFLA